MKRTLVLLLLLGSVSTAHAVVVSDQMEAITQYLLVDAPKVTVAKTSDPAVAEIRIKPTGLNLISARPRPFLRNIPTNNLNNSIWNGIFERQSIPASLTWIPDKSVEQGVFLNVSLKKIDKKTGTIIFRASINSTPSVTLSDKAIYVGRPFKFGILKNATIALDDQSGRVIRGNGLRGPNAMKTITSSDQPPIINGCVIQPYTVCSRADVSYANLEGVDLSYSIFDMATLDFANLSNANAFRSVFWGAFLRGSNLHHAVLYQSDFSNSDLFDADVGETNMSYSAFFGAYVQFRNDGTADLHGSSGCETATPPITYLCNPP